MTETIAVRVVYLGGSRTQAETPAEILQLPVGARVGDAVGLITRLHPLLVPFLPRARWAKNMDFTTDDAPLAAGDELALVPPVCGGADRTCIQEMPIAVGDVIQRVQRAHFGATVVFTGTVRNHNAGHAVAEMTYEAYRPMADRQLEKIADACCEGGGEMAIAHRTGAMQVGDVTIAIAAAHVHRDEAFAACRKAIEAVKHEVPIFKREATPEGEIWVGWGS